ncbi:MAG: DUF3375 family protein [Spirochaetaceae bacterium]|nr:DUF3375 family protein [Spirochaetaceae bacterium]
MLSDISNVEHLIKNDSGLTLLTKRNAPFIISFLYKQFKEDKTDNSFGIEQSYLVHVLSTYLNSIDQNELVLDDEYLDTNSSIELDNDDKALNLIKSWSDPKNGFVFRYYDEDGYEMIEASAGLERLFRYLNDVSDSKKLFISTESRFADILEKLRELDENTIENPLSRIEELERQKLEIDKQIAEIKETGRAAIFTPLQVQERISTIQKTAADLLSDFRQLKDNNHKIFAELCHKQLEITENRGTLLGFILEQSNELENSPQGQSFNGFWKYLSAIEADATIAIKAEKIHKRLPNQKLDLNFFNNFEDALFVSGKNILDENHLLSERLKKVIIRKSSADFQYISNTLKEIKTIIVFNPEKLPYKQDFMKLDGNAEYSNAMVRPLVLPKGEGSGELAEYKVVEAPAFDFTQLLTDIYVNEDNIREIIEAERNLSIKEIRVLTLQYILEKHPIKYGLAEVLTYLSILFRSPFTTIDDSKTDEIYYRSSDNKKNVKLTIPKVVINND